MAYRKKEFSPTLLSEHSIKTLRRLEETKLFQSSSCIAIYHPLPGEVETADFIEKWAREKTILLPIAEGDDLRLVRYISKNSLKKGAFGIMEPEECVNPCNLPDIDLLIIPGIAFDRQGNRLGRGKGYYDRLLATIDAPKLGICFDFQLHDTIPIEEFDKKMDCIITPEETIFCSL